MGNIHEQTLSRYLLSLPERTVRSAAALCAGLVREIGYVTLPPGVRRTKLYTVMVETTLRFLIEQVGQVEGAYLTYLTREFQPYLNGAAKQFSLSHRSMTDRLLDRVSRRIS